MHSSQYNKLIGNRYCVTVLPPQIVKQFHKSYMKQGEREVVHSLYKLEN